MWKGLCSGAAISDFCPLILTSLAVCYTFPSPGLFSATHLLPFRISSEAEPVHTPNSFRPWRLQNVLNNAFHPQAARKGLSLKR